MHVQGQNRDQATLFPERQADLIGEDNAVRVIDAFVDSPDLKALVFARFESKLMMRRRKAMVEHPIGTSKRRMDSGRFLVKSRDGPRCYRLQPDPHHQRARGQATLPGAGDLIPNEKRPPQMRWPLGFCTASLAGPFGNTIWALRPERYSLPAGLFGPA